MEHGVVLCGANSYEQKYYFNEEDFGSLPESIKKELHIMCVLYTEDVYKRQIYNFFRWKWNTHDLKCTVKIRRQPK